MNRFLATVALVFCCLAASADEPVPQQLPPDQEAAAIHFAETRGSAIYRHDQAASLATDAAFKLPAFRSNKRIKGWITEEHQQEMVVTFFDQTPSALYRVVVSNDGIAGPVTALAPPAPLTGFELGAANARMAASASDFKPCSSTYNTVVLTDPDKPGTWVVYLLPGTTKSNLVPIGGTYRMEVKGSTIVSRRSFTLTCIAMRIVPREVAMMITHLMDPVPTEAHVFWSLWAGMPMYVATPPNGTIWVIDGGKIKLVERK